MIGTWAPRLALRVALLGAVLVGGGAARAIQPLLALQQKVTASDGAQDDLFGHAVAIEGDTAIVGGILAASHRGAAYVFQRTVTGWTEVAQLTADDTETGKAFGFAVALSGDTAVIGRAHDDDHGPWSGSAYVFQRSGGTWAQVAKLTPADAAADDYFGASVSIAGDTAIISSHCDDDAGSLSGSAYIFQRTGGTWTQVAKLTAADAAAGDMFGCPVSLDGDTAIIGAFYDDDGGSASGSAYIFQRNGGTWAQAAKLTAADAAAGDEFGASISLDGDTAIIGAPYDDDGGTASGSAYIFQRTGGVWAQAAKLIAGDAAAEDWFGGAVSISGNLATIGASGVDESTGAAYVFQRAGTTWAQVVRLSASDRPEYAGFGRPVAIWGDTVLVGAFYDDALGGDSGSAYFLHLLLPAADAVAAADGEGADEFGGAVAISGDCALVGAARDDDGGHDAGAAYVYRRLATGWTEEGKLTASDAASSDRFGWAVAVDGTTAVVGAPGKSSSMGAAYIFARNKSGVWTQTKKLVGSDSAAGHTFGSAVAIYGDLVLVGAPKATGAVANAGVVYFFERDHGGVGNWGQAQRATASDGAASDGFGAALALQGEVALLGAPQELRARPNPGAVYVFELDHLMSKWGQTAKLTASDGANGDLFGGALGFAGNTAVVGARGRAAPGADAGAAYVFQRNRFGGWDAAVRLLADDAAAADAFGRAVAVADDLIVVGADGDDDLGALSGSAYVFRRTAVTANPWACIGKLGAISGNADDKFGWAVALDGVTALVGAPFAAPGRANTGVATFYELEPAAPTVTSITRLNPSGAPTNVAAVTFQVTFAAAVHNVQAGNFTLTTTGGQAGASISALSASSGTVLSVAVATVPGLNNGNIRLDLSAPTGIIGSWFTPMTATYTAGQTQTIDRTPPAAPAVSGPASPTDQRRPTWSWTRGGDGNGTFRRKLDDPSLESGATETTATAWTPPADLGDGWHALYVQERDSAGNWSAAGSFGVYVGRPVLIVTADDTERLYGDPNPAFTVQISGFVGDGDIGDLTTLPTATCGATPTSPSDKYEIVPAGGADDAYDFAYINGTLTVGPAPLTCTADNKNRAYGDANPTLTIGYTGLRNGATAPASPPSAACSADQTSPVGAYAITLSGGSDPNYTLTRVAGVLTIGKRTLTVTAHDATRPYGDANPAFALGYSGFVNGDDPEDLDSRPRATCVASATSSPGAYPIVPAGGADANYDVAHVNGTLTVEPAPVTCTADDQSRSYGDGNPALTISYTGLRNGAANPVGRPVATCPADAASPPGAYPITLSGGSDPNYTLTLVPGTLTVGKRTLTVTADSVARDYGDPNPAFTVQISGFVWDEAIADLTTPPTATCSATPASPSGAYAIVPGGGFDDVYDFAYVNGTLTVGPVPLTCSADDLNRPYGDDNAALTIGYTGLRNGDMAPATPPSAACSADRASPVGAYPITLSGGADPNYTLTLVPGTLTIAPAPLTCSADGRIRPYGQANPVLAITCIGLRNADSAPAVPPVAACAADATSPVGAYPITLSGGSDPNYTLTLVPGTLTVEKADQTIAFAALAERTYGDAPFELAATATSGLPVYFGSSDQDVAVLSAGRGWTASIVGAGASVIDAFQNGDANWNAAPALPRTLTVHRAALSLTAAAALRRLGQPNPAFTANAAGLQNGDTLASIGLAVSYACVADELSPPGAYPITPSGAATTADYSVMYLAGTLTVTDREIPVITWATPAPITYGTALGAAQLNATANTPGSFVYTPPAGTVLAAGYRLLAVAFTPDDTANYAATGGTAQLTVDPALLTAIAQNAARPYGDANPAFALGYSGFVNGDGAADLDSPPTVTCAATPASAAGGYSIVPVGGTDNNYVFGYVDGTLTVEPAALTCTAAGQSRSYGQANPALTIGYSGLKNGEAGPAVPPSAACVADATSPVGAYPITLSGGSDPNYTLTLVPGTLAIDKADQTIAFAALAERTYGDAPFELAATATSGLPVYFGSGDPDVAALSAGRGWTVSIVGAGASVIDAFQNGDGNWNAAPPLPRTLTVHRAALSLTAAAALRRVGQPNPAFTANAAGLQNGDTLASIGLAVFYACAADELSPPGAYPIAPSGAATTADYSVTYLAGTLTVTDKEIPVITWPAPAAITYGTALGATQLNATANTPGSFVYTPPAGTVLEAGSRLLAVAFTPDDTASYVATGATVQLLVDPARLTVTAQSATRPYGDANPAFTVGYAGFVNGDDAADLDSPSTATCAATLASAAGRYSIVPDGGTDNNYAFGYVDGTLTVAPAALTCTADDQSRSYGQANPPLTIGYTGLKNGEAGPAVPPSAACSAGLASPVGAYPITLSGGSDPNYSLTLVPGTLTVGKADQTIAFAALAERTYGDAPFELAATASSGLPVRFESSDADVAGLSAGRGWTASIAGAGTCTISAFQNGDGNWNAAPALPRTLTVHRAALSLTAAAASRRLGQPNPVFAANAAGLQNGDTLASIGLAVSYACAADELSPPGAYPITPSGADSTTDYTVVYVAGTLTVTDKEVPAITWPAPAAITYGTALGAAQLNATANTPGTFVYTPLAGTLLEAGPGHLLRADFAPDDPAQWLTASATVSLEVLRADQAIAFANPGDKVYTDTFALSATGGGSGNPVTFTVTAGPAVLGAGNLLSFTDVGEVTLTAAQAGNANWNAAAPVSRTFAVARATPAISWAAPAPIEYGTALAALQLNAAANTPGVFAYTPAAGTQLARGTHTLAVTFTPDDTAHWANTAAEQTIEVVDTSAPVLAAVFPAAAALGVAHDAALVLTFSETVVAGSGAIRIVAADGTLFESLDVAGRGAVSVVGPTVTVAHGPFAAGSVYHVLVASTCFQDVAGNAFAGITDPSAWTFTARPWVVQFSAGVHGVLLGPSVQTVNHGAAATAPLLQADEGWIFTGWDADIAHVAADLTVTAHYVRLTHTVRFRAAVGGSVGEPATQTVDHGASTEPVTAVPAFGYVFSQWDDGSSANPRTLHQVTADATLTASFRQADAVVPNGSFRAPLDAAGVGLGRGLWDLTGAYTTTVNGNLLTLNMIHDNKGRITGTATLQVNTGKALVPVIMPIRGNAKGNGGVVVVSLALQGANAAAAVRVSLALNLTLDVATRQLRGPVTGGCTIGLATTPVSGTAILDIPAPMDGTWMLSLNLVQRARTLSGTARLTLANGVEYLYTLRGRLNGGTTVLDLSARPSSPGAQSIELRATFTTLEGGWARLTALTGKGYGQVLLW